MTAASRPPAEARGAPGNLYDTGTRVRVRRPEYPDQAGVVLAGGSVSGAVRALYLVTLDPPHLLASGKLQRQVVLYNTELEEDERPPAAPVGTSSSAAKARRRR